jgi:hypothetical protein
VGGCGLVREVEQRRELKAWIEKNAPDAREVVSESVQ